MKDLGSVDVDIVIFVFIIWNIGAFSKCFE